MFTITESAQEYLVGLLSKQEPDVRGVRVFINNPGTARAETCLAYCRDADILGDDERRNYDGFDAWFEARSVPFLEDALIDYAVDRMGGQLTIKAPNAKLPKLSDDSPLEDRINYVIQDEINPQLAMHSGEVFLADLEDGDVAVLQFGGSCQGCGMVAATLKNGVERTLLEKFPELKGVRDVTDHSVRTNAYYK